MHEGIIDADIQILITTNPLAAEQLRRIIAERNREELQAELSALKASSNGAGADITELETAIETT